jgi:hypothetical protein
MAQRLAVRPQRLWVLPADSLGRLEAAGSSSAWAALVWQERKVSQPPQVWQPREQPGMSFALQAERLRVAS